MTAQHLARMHIRRVVFPQPLGPSNAYTVPALTSRLRLSKTCKVMITTLIRIMLVLLLLMILLGWWLWWYNLAHLEIVVPSHCSLNNESWRFEKRSRHFFFLRSSWWSLKEISNTIDAGAGDFYHKCQVIMWQMMMKSYEQKHQRIFCGASQNVMLNPITLTKSKRCWGHFFVSLVFRFFLSNPFFLIYKTHVALFSVYTSLHPPLQLWVSEILISTQTYFLSGQDL